MAVTVKDPAEPVVKVVVSAEVMAGASFTVSVNGWVASLPIPLFAPMVIENEPEAVGVPESTPVVELKLTPAGSVPDSLKDGAG